MNYVGYPFNDYLFVDTPYVVCLQLIQNLQLTRRVKADGVNSGGL
jgi:hypothetical protein